MSNRHYRGIEAKEEECASSSRNFSTSALPKNVVLNSLKVTVKKLRVENGVTRIQLWSSENYSRRLKFPNLPRFVRQRRQHRLQSYGDT